jgi:hypothetical protein
MQAQFWLINEDYRRAKLLGLKKKRCQCYKAQRSIRQGRSVEVLIRFLVPPLQSDVGRFKPPWLKQEVVKKRGHLLNGTNDQMVRARALLSKQVKNCGQIRTVGSQEAIVIDFRGLAPG